MLEIEKKCLHQNHRIKSKKINIRITPSNKKFLRNILTRTQIMGYDRVRIQNNGKSSIILNRPNPGVRYDFYPHSDSGECRICTCDKNNKYCAGYIKNITWSFEVEH